MGCSRKVLRTKSDTECERRGEDDKAEIRAAAEHIVSIFWEPLEAKGAYQFSLDDELDFAGSMSVTRWKITN